MQVLCWRGEKTEMRTENSILSSQLSLRTTGIQSHWGSPEDNEDSTHQNYHLMGERAGVFIHELLLVLSECALGALNSAPWRASSLGLKVGSRSKRAQRQNNAGGMWEPG